MAGEGSRFAYDPGVLRYGASCVDALSEELDALGRERALVVTGRTVGQTAAVMDPVRAGLGDRLAGVFAETTPEKRLSTALDGARALEERDAGAIVAVGGGSSMDTARAIATLAGRDLGPAEAGAEFADSGTIAVPDRTPPILAVPTTLAGAEQSTGGGLSADPEVGPVDEAVSGGLGDPSLAPAAAFYDPDVVATTPRSVLVGSAMNGFDKGLESIYSRHATPVTDGTAARGLRRFAEGLLSFEGDYGEGDYQEGIPAATEGLLLVQYGASRPDASTFSVIHALGKFVAQAGDLQQGVGHAIVAPAVLEAIFEEVDGRRELLADGLGVGGADDSATAVVDRVAAVCEALGVETQVRDVGGIGREDLPEIARQAAAHPFAENGPRELDPSSDWFEGALERAW